VEKGQLEARASEGGGTLSKEEFVRKDCDTVQKGTNHVKISKVNICLKTNEQKKGRRGTQ